MCKLRNLPALPVMAENVVSAYREAADTLPSTAFRAASTWYHGARSFVESVSEETETPFDVVLWLTAYFSANADWNTNKLTVRRFIRAYRAGDVYSPSMFATKRMRTRAAQVMAGKLAPTADTLTSERSRAFKLPSFFRNIGTPQCPFAVTVDRHAARIATGDDSVSVPTGGAYERIADAYRLAAEEIGVAASVVQAVTWTAKVGDLP